MIRVLIIVTPRMYRQAIALSIRRQRSGLEVRVASPEATERELTDFRPHLLVHNDNDELGPEPLTDIPFQIEVQYSNGMDAQIRAGGEVSTVRDMSTEDLLGVVDRAIALANPEARQR
jgi:hypothetical protein